MKNLLFFLKQLKFFRWQLALGLLLSMTLAFSSIALLALAGWFIAASALAGLSATTAANFNYFIPSAIIRLLALMRISSRYFDRVVNHDITLHILARLRVWFYQQLLPLSPARLLTHHSGKLLHQITQDIDTLDHTYLNTFSPLLIAIMVIVSTTLFICYFSATTSIVLFIMMIVSLLTLCGLLAPKGIKLGAEKQHVLSSLRVELIEFLQGWMERLQFTSHKQKQDVLFSQLASTQKKMARQKGLALGGMQFFSGFTLFLLLWLNTSLVQYHLLSGPILVMLVLLTMGVFEQIAVIPMALLTIGHSLSAANNIRAVTMQQPTVIFPSAEKVVSNVDIAIHQLTFRYPHRPANVIHGFSAKIPYQSKIGICGPSGSGKSTLAYLLTRVWDPQSGNIVIGNIPLQELSESQLRNTLTLVTQQPHMFHTSIRDNLVLSREHITDDMCWQVLEKMELSDVIRQLPDKLDTLMGEFGKHFSGGQIRRIALARALLPPIAPILILDEPSAGLEEALMSRVWKNCEADFSNRTVIVLSHDEKLLAKMEKVIILS